MAQLVVYRPTLCVCIFQNFAVLVLLLYLGTAHKSRQIVKAEDSACKNNIEIVSKRKLECVARFMWENKGGKTDLQGR